MKAKKQDLPTRDAEAVNFSACFRCFRFRFSASAYASTKILILFTRLRESPCSYPTNVAAADLADRFRFGIPAPNAAG